MTSCGHCGAAAAAKRCARCRAVAYCSQACQKAHWKAHKAACKRAAALLALSLPALAADAAYGPDDELGFADRADPEELPLVLAALRDRGRSATAVEVAKLAIQINAARTAEEDDFLQNDNGDSSGGEERALVEQLCAKDDAFSLAFAGKTILSSIAFHGNEAAHADQQRALELLGRARALGSCHASCELGTFYEHVCETPNQEAAMALYEEAVARGSRAASYPLGWCHFMGRAGMPIDKRAALRCFVSFSKPMAPPEYLNLTLPTNTMSLITVAQLLMEEEETFGPNKDLVADLLLQARDNGDSGMSSAFLVSLDADVLARANKRASEKKRLTLADVPPSLWA